MNTYERCIYCKKEHHNWPLGVCKSCIKLWNDNWEKFIPRNNDWKKLTNDCEKYVKQAMTRHTCGIDAGGDPHWFYSSNCIGCEPETTQHYRNAAELVIAWTENWIKKNIMKNILLKKRVA